MIEGNSKIDGKKASRLRQENVEITPTSSNILSRGEIKKKENRSRCYVVNNKLKTANSVLRKKVN